MTLVSLTIPDDAAEWPAWLERQIIGLRLGELIEELKIIAPAAEPAPNLDDIIGGHWDDVLENGLAGLPSDRLRHLIRHPERLLELQERVFIDGGSYWQNLPVDADVQACADSVAKRVKQELARASHDPVVPAAADGESRGLVNRRIYAIAAVLAASVLVAFGIWFQQHPDPQMAFIWESPDLLAADLPPAKYGASLSTSLGDWWFSEQPQTNEELSKRLQRFRAGCETVIGARHPQLTDEEREQLITKCQNWLVKIDGHLAQLAAGGNDLQTVQEEADTTVRSAMKALSQLFAVS